MRGDPRLSCSCRNPKRVRLPIVITQSSRIPGIYTSPYHGGTYRYAIYYNRIPRIYFCYNYYIRVIFIALIFIAFLHPMRCASACMRYTSRRCSTVLHSPDTAFIRLPRRRSGPPSPLRAHRLARPERRVSLWLCSPPSRRVQRSSPTATADLMTI